MFSNPLGLLALAAVPAVVLLHLFRRRFTPRVVSALFLWETPSLTSLTGRRRDRVLRTPSFWTEVLLALILGLAIAGPRACSGLAARHWVAVLDSSASMSASPSGESEKSFAEAALDEIERRIDALPGGSRVTLVLSGDPPRLLAGPAAFPREALAALEDYPGLASAGRHDLEPATSLALQLAGEGAVTLFTDRFEPERFPPRVGLVSHGRPVANVGITRAARLALGSEAGEEVLLTVASFARAPRLTAVELHVGQETLAHRELRLEPGAREHLRFELPPGLPALRATIDADAFPIDDEAWLVPPPSRTLLVASALKEETERRLGLSRAGEVRLERWRRLVGDARVASSPAEARLALATEVVGAEATWCLVLHPPEGEPIDLVGPFLMETRHELLRGVTLEGVVWTASSGARLPGVPLVSAGNRPLLSEEVTPSRRLYHADLDLARSSLFRSPDWPILLDNLAEARRAELAGPRRKNLAVGETFHFVARGEADYVLSTPRGERELRGRDGVLVEDLDVVGRYSLRQGGREVADFAVHFAVHFGDDSESDLRELSSGERASSTELAEERAGSSRFELWLGALALCGVLLDGFFLRQRRAPAQEVGP